MNALPKYKEERFQCPYCGIVAKQDWNDCDTLGSYTQEFQRHFFLEYRAEIKDYFQEAISVFLGKYARKYPYVLRNLMPRNFAFSSCHSCKQVAIWIEQRMVFPKPKIVEPPNPDLDPDISAIYNEAANIVGDSPKGAAALLRLALQKLMVQLGESGENINDDIKNLVEKGLKSKIQQSLDLIRVIGNNAVHPGRISFDDDNRHIALTMFKLLNMIAHDMITQPKEIDQLYSNIIPEETKKCIDNRDKNAG